MNKLLKALMLCVGVLAGHVNYRDINRCGDGFGSVSVEEYAESNGVELDSYDIQISQSQVYIVMKVSKK